MGRKRILIVEDEAMTAMALADYLEDLGHEVLEIPSSGEEALRLARAGRPNLVLMDVNLPGSMDGIETARLIAGEMPVVLVFITGYSNTALMERAKALSPAAYIIKPFDFSALDGILEAIH